MITQTHRELTEEEILRIKECYQEWQAGSPHYSDIPGFCRSSSIQEIAKRRYILAPGRYVGYESSATEIDDHKGLDELVSNLEERLQSARLLDQQILSALKQFQQGV